MKVIGADIHGVVALPVGSTDFDVAETHGVTTAGTVVLPVGDSDVSVFASGPVPFVVVRDIDRLSGAKHFARGPGLYNHIGCERGQYITVIDQTSQASLRVVHRTEQLPGEVKALASNDDYVFAYLRDPRSGMRYLEMRENTVELGFVMRSILDDEMHSAWLALEPQAGVLAYPEGTSLVTLRDANTLELLHRIDCHMGDSSTAGWFRFFTGERPSGSVADETVRDRQWFLYVISEHQGQASVLRWRELLFEDA